MRRLFWVVLGITVGALVMRKLSRVAERLTPRGLAQSVGGGLAELSESLRDFTGEVRDAMQEREVTLRAGAGLDGALGSAATGGSASTVGSRSEGAGDTP